MGLPVASITISIPGWRIRASRIIAHKGRAALQRRVEARCRKLFRGPADKGEVGAGSPRIQVGNTHNMDARQPQGMRQEHGTEFSGADQTDANGPAFFRPLLQFVKQVHGLSLNERDWTS